MPPGDINSEIIIWSWCQQLSKLSFYYFCLKVHVWAGISTRGATQVCIFSGCMESLGYQDILRRNLLPFTTEVFPDGHRLWQDNDPKHTSNSTKKWMQENGINHWPTPPKSPVSFYFFLIILMFLWRDISFILK